MSAPTQKDIDHWTELSKEYDALPQASEIHDAASQAVLTIIRSQAGVSDQEMSGWNVLEVGGGTGAVTSRLLPSFGSICVTDTSKAMLTQLSLKSINDPQRFSHCSHYLISIDPNVEHAMQTELPSPVVGNEGRMLKPERAAGFDLVYGTLMLHHVDDIPGFMQGVARLVKPGGFVVFQEFALTEEEARDQGGRQGGHSHHHHHHEQGALPPGDAPHSQPDAHNNPHLHSHTHHASHGAQHVASSSKAGPLNHGHGHIGFSESSLRQIFEDAGLHSIKLETYGQIPMPRSDPPKMVGNLLGLGRRGA